MKEFVIIGQSVAAYMAIVTMVEAKADYHITLIPTDGKLPYDRDVFPKLMTLGEKDTPLFCAEESFYKKNKVTVISGKEISRINFTRRKIFLADRIQLDYDALFITDAPQIRLPDVKGVKKEGVFHLARLDTVRSVFRRLPFVETAVVVASSVRGLETALALKLAGKEVILCSSSDSIIPLNETDMPIDVLNGLIERSGLRFFQNTRVEDILGESEVQAVRFSSGKVIASELVIYESVIPDLRFLMDTDIILQERICVHSNMRSNLPDVYAADAMIELVSPRIIGSYSLDQRVLCRQGECTAKAILGLDDHIQPDFVKMDSNKLESIFPMDVLAHV